MFSCVGWTPEQRGGAGGGYCWMCLVAIGKKEWNPRTIWASSMHMHCKLGHDWVRILGHNSYLSSRRFSLSHLSMIEIRAHNCSPRIKQTLTSSLLSLLSPTTCVVAALLVCRRCCPCRSGSPSWRCCPPKRRVPLPLCNHPSHAPPPSPPGHTTLPSAMRHTSCAVAMAKTRAARHPPRHRRHGHLWTHSPRRRRRPCRLGPRGPLPPRAATARGIVGALVAARRHQLRARTVATARRWRLKNKKNQHFNYRFSTLCFPVSTFLLPLQDVVFPISTF